MRVLICGGRRFSDLKLLFDTLDRMHASRTFSMVINGGARGADAMARVWARNNGIEILTFHPDWAKHGRAAGPIRNQRMIERGRLDLVIAFPGGAGTADMIARSRAVSLEVMVIPCSM